MSEKDFLDSTIRDLLVVWCNDQRGPTHVSAHILLKFKEQAILNWCDWPEEVKLSPLGNIHGICLSWTLRELTKYCLTELRVRLLWRLKAGQIVAEYMTVPVSDVIETLLEEQTVSEEKSSGT